MADQTPKSPRPSGGELKGNRIGRILTKMGKVSRDQVQEALQLQTKRHQPIGQLLIELGYVTEADVEAALAAQAGIETLDLEQLEIPDSVAHILPAETAQAYQVLPLQYDTATNTLTVALKSASNFRAVDDLRLLMGYNVRPVVADPQQIDKIMGKFYGGDSESLSALIGDLAGDSKLEELKDRGESIDLDTLLEAAEDNKVKRLLNLVLMQAIKDKGPRTFTSSRSRTNSRCGIASTACSMT